MAHLTPPHCVTLNWQSHEIFLGQGFLAPLHLAGIKIMSSTGRGALGVTSPVVLQPQDSSHPSILPQSAYKHFSCSLFRRDAPCCPLVSSGLTFETCTFPQILHYYSMVRDGVVLLSLVAAPPRSLPMHYPSVLFIFRTANICVCTITGHPQTLFN